MVISGFTILVETFSVGKVYHTHTRPVTVNACRGSGQEMFAL